MKLIYLSLLLIFYQTAFTQSIIGPSSVVQGSTFTYSYQSEIIHLDYSWTVVNGVRGSESQTGDTYFISVSWPTEGSGTIQFRDMRGTVVATKTVIIDADVREGCSAPPQPNTSITIENQICGSTTVSYDGTVPLGQIWYWQSSALGQSFAFDERTFTTGIVTGDYYYLRPYSFKCGLWGPALAVDIPIKQIPQTPSIPTASTNTCGAKTLSKATAPTGAAWYWQGTNSNGTDYTSATATAGTYTVSSNGTATYYLRARNNASGCWSTSVGKSVTVDNPAPPTALSKQHCQFQDPMILSPTGSLSNIKWYNSSNQLVYTGLSYSLSNMDIGTHQFTVKNVSAAGCTGATGSTVSLTVLTCDSYVNWNQTESYIPNGSSETLAGSSREYNDGFGKPLQSQTKSFSKNHVLAVQGVPDARGNQSLVTLPAPINSSSFGYRHRFITNNASPQTEKYSADDFDKRVSTNAVGEVNNPRPVGNNGRGSLGWYYSTANDLEPNTPVTNFPFSRSYTPEGPNPTSSESTGPGDQTRMGLNRESVTDRVTFQNTELSHYYAIKTFFSNDANSDNVVLSNDAETKNDFAVNQNVLLSDVVANGETYVKCVTNQTTSTPGIRRMGGSSIAVAPGQTYKFRVKGYRQSANVNLWVKNLSANTNLLWAGASLPSGAANEAWVENTITIPAGCTSIELGALFNGLTSAHLYDAFYINAVQLIDMSPSTFIAGYKITSTDPNGKKAVTFTDAEGKSLASATLTGSTYDNWSYTFYNDAGQVVASVAPKGVNRLSNAYPSFVTTYKYDHFGRLIETESIDEGRTEYTYDIEGRIRFSQNEVQRNATPKRFSYTNYDHVGRLVESGEYACSGTNPYVFETHSTATPATYSVLNIVDNKIKDIDAVTSSNYTGVSYKLDATRCADYTFIKYDYQAPDLPEAAWDYVGPGLYSVQTNLDGKISRTKNANATTWYSYNEFGEVLWTMQTGSGIGEKTVDYVYDAAGNVTQVAYQKTKPDAFYHHYYYDADQRLSEVRTSKNGSTMTTRARYHYYLHGPLKRIELMNGTTAVQGIDYVYTIDGSLKGINNSDPERDPGADGIANSFPEDVFGATLHYHSNDYQGASHNAGPQTFSGYLDQYNGMVKGITWNSPVDNNKMKGYAYAYDNKYQISTAKFGDFTGGTFSNAGLDAFQENVPSYDKNGNINSLVRDDKYGTTVDNYSYVYEPNTNKLDKVNNNGVLMTDYTYNEIGQMISQTEGGVTYNFVYNASGLVKEIRNASNQLIQQYGYDDRGDLLRKTFYNAGTAQKNTFYVSDASGNTMAIYEQILPGGAVTLAEVPFYGSGRIGIHKPATNMYYYEMNDHLGNVRAVIGQPDTYTHTATMESETSEEPPFKNIANRRAIFLAANAVPTGGNEVVRLNRTQPDGPTLMLPVSPGDKLDFEVYAYYESGTGYNVGLPGIVTAIASGFGGVQGAPGDPGTIYNNVSSGLGLSGGAAGTSGSATVPGAFIHWIFFDINFKPLYYDKKQVTSSSNMAKAKIVMNQLTASEPGYLYVFVYNNTDSQNWVYFDGLKVTHQYTPIVAGGDYYPFGLAMEGRTVRDESYRFGYQGQFSEKDLATGLQEFESRMYDARIGRWISTDPAGQFASPYTAMGNTPNVNVDPDGEWSLVGSAVGAAAGVGLSFAVGDQDRWYLYAAGGFIAGGILGEAAHSSHDYTSHAANGWDRFTAIFGEGKVSGAMGSSYVRYPLNPKWKEIAHSYLSGTSQGVKREWCVYACSEVVERALGGVRRMKDFASGNNGGKPLDKGVDTNKLGLYYNKNFPRSIKGQGARQTNSAPSPNDIASQMKKGNIVSTVIDEGLQKGYNHNVIMQRVQRNIRKPSKYRYVILDPARGIRYVSEKQYKKWYRVHIILGK